MIDHKNWHSSWNNIQFLNSMVLPVVEDSCLQIPVSTKFHSLDSGLRIVFPGLRLQCLFKIAVFCFVMLEMLSQKHSTAGLKICRPFSHKQISMSLKSKFNLQLFIDFLAARFSSQPQHTTAGVRTMVSFLFYFINSCYTFLCSNSQLNCSYGFCSILRSSAGTF